MVLLSKYLHIVKHFVDARRRSTGSTALFGVFPPVAFSYGVGLLVQLETASLGLRADTLSMVVPIGDQAPMSPGSPRSPLGAANCTKHPTRP